MEVFNALRKRIETVNQGLRSGLYIRQIVEENEAFIVDMNAENQLLLLGSFTHFFNPPHKYSIKQVI